ncbi:MAG TPA: dienelactone hydrolase family protein [Stellaceae bacterium]|nr:dienelactone hydrolase family protein [Stellaceae bacterium]
MSTITLDGASGFLAKAKHPHAGVLLLPMIYGVNRFVQDYAASLAERGLTTFVWDPYPDETLPEGRDAALNLAKELRDGPSLDSMAICIDFLMGELRLDQIGTIGFCLGGRYCLMLAAKETRIGACAAVYPTIEMPRRANQDEDAVLRAGEIQCPVQLVVPGHDHVTNAETYERLQTALERRSAYTLVQRHPEAQHGFMHTPDPANALATKRSRPVLSAFLEACLT